MMQRFAAPQSGAQVSLTLGERFSLTLDEHPSTGYLWDVQWGHEHILQLVSDHYHSSGEPERLGAGGTHEWLFEAKQAGACPLTLVLQRPWEREDQQQPMRVYTLKVMVAMPPKEEM